MFMYSPAAKPSTTDTTETATTTTTTTTETTTRKSIDFFILSVFPFLALQWPFNTKYRGKLFIIALQSIWVTQRAGRL